MDAEVLSPRMMADINGNNKITNAELEVLKLQELVRKLEKQNEQLRSRAQAVNSCSSGPELQNRSGETPSHSDCFCPKHELHSPGQSAPCVPAGSPDSPHEPFHYFQPSSAPPQAATEERSSGAERTVLDELEVLDLDLVLPVGDPETWLYVSPRVGSQSGGSQSGGVLAPLQWCRQVLDRPGPEVELARMSLCHRLDQVRRRRGVSSVRPFSCIEGLSSSLSCSVLPYTKTALTEPAAPLLSSSSSFISPSLPLRASCSLGDRAPSFLSNASVHSVGRQRAAISPQSSLDSEVGVSELEDDSISMSYKLQDMTDVEVMARLQEESLRQDYASTSATVSRRSSSFSLHSLRRSHMDLEEEDEEEEAYDQLPPPQPRLFRTGSMQRGGGGLPHSHTFSNIRDYRRSSVGPQVSFSGLPQHQGPQPGPQPGLSSEPHTGYRTPSDKLRRSMPNLIRAPSMPSVPSMPCLASPVTPPSHGPSSLPTVPSLRSSHSFDSSNGLARLHSSIPSPGQLTQRVHSVGNFSSSLSRPPVKATAYVSPTVQQGPSSLSSSVSLHSLPSAAALPQPLKPSGGGLVPQPLKAGTNQHAAPRSSLPRPASFLGGATRQSKISQSTRSLLTPPKSLAALSALRDGSWKDGCY